MLIFEPSSPPPKPMQNAVVALGNFDGVHLGHQVVLQKAREQARKHNKPFGVVTFEPHPRSVFAPADAPFRITPAHTKRRILADLGVDVCFEIPFTYEFSKLGAEQFVEDLLLGQLHISHAVAGHDFVFGHKRGGDMRLLKQLMKKHHLHVDEVSPVYDNSHVLWSSTRIREVLQKGDPKSAAAALGRNWEIEGIVQRGAQRGRTIGFPTANLSLDCYQRPRFGIYAVTVTHAGKQYQGVANIGIRPTVDGERESLEVHIFDFAGDLYEQSIRIGFVDFIRPEQRFEGLDALKNQIKQDCLVAKQMLA
ncbi:MAG: bifunctional riboflavin kinase/FAD synthetase [Alphaproteobacteria bacterium]|nr:bifunctional riboflavin kinase/FAD synthetase [Alphaproteobacteria bacterium]